MKKTIATIVGSGLLILGAVSLQPEKVVTKEFSLDGEKVIVNPEPVQKEVLGGLVTRKVFKPDVKLERFGGETFLRVWSDNEVLPNAIEQDGKIISKSIDGKREYHFYTKTKEELQNENGGFEYEIILKDKPATNTISLLIKTKGLNFYYQSPLTEEIKVGDRKGEIVKVTETDAYIKDEKTGELISANHRPENVVGSYAVYHESKSGDYSKMGGKNYKTGKAFHIYRPKIIDANGNWTWGKLNIDEKKEILTIEIDQNFLDKAVYPVKVDPTFGYTTAGATEDGWFPLGSDYYWRTKFIAPENGSITSMSAFVGCYYTSFVKESSLCIYDDSGNYLIHGTISHDCSTSDGWESTNVSYNVTNGIVYRFGHASPNGLTQYYDSGFTGQSSIRAHGGDYSDPSTDTEPDDSISTYTDRKYSIYATYTTSGGTTSQTQQNPFIIIFD